MSGSSTWLDWLAGLARASGWWGPVPESLPPRLEALRQSGLLRKELTKPPEQQDEELVHRLRVQYRKAQLLNAQAEADEHGRIATKLERPGFECCTAAGWVRQRQAASHRAMQDYDQQYIQQLTEELAAAEARRPAALVVQPTIRLHLPGALQHPPSRLEMCSACARRLEVAEMRELSLVLHGQDLQKRYRGRGLQPAHVAASPEAAKAAAAAEAPRAFEAQQGSQQRQQQCGAGTDGGVKADDPATPTQPPPQQQQQQQRQHASLIEEQQHTGNIGAANQQAVAGQLTPQ